MAHDPEHKVIFLEIPVSEFEFLHAEVKRLRAGWSDAEAQIASLQARVGDLGVKLTHEVGFREKAEAENALLIAAIDKAHPHAEPKPGCALCEALA